MRLIFLSSLFGFANCQYYKMTFDEEAHRSRSSIQPWTIDNGNGCVLKLHFWKSVLFGQVRFAAALLQGHVGETTARLIKETDVNPCIEATEENFHKDESPSEFSGHTITGAIIKDLGNALGCSDGKDAFAIYTGPIPSLADVGQGRLNRACRLIAHKHAAVAKRIRDVDEKYTQCFPRNNARYCEHLAPGIQRKRVSESGCELEFLVDRVNDKGRCNDSGTR
jgi:hypothetical protein